MLVGELWRTCGVHSVVEGNMVSEWCGNIALAVQNLKVAL